MAAMTDVTKGLYYMAIGSMVVLLILTWIIGDIYMPFGNPFGWVNQNASAQTRLAIMTALLGTGWFLCLSPSERRISIR